MFRHHGRQLVVSPLLSQGTSQFGRTAHCRRKSYWENFPVSSNGRPRDPSARLAGSLGEALLESACLQLMSDVPIAFFSLSGGVHSAILGALMARAGAQKLTALTIGFEETHLTSPNRVAGRQSFGLASLRRYSSCISNGIS